MLVLCTVIKLQFYPQQFGVMKMILGLVHLIMQVFVHVLELINLTIFSFYYYFLFHSLIFQVHKLVINIL